MMRFSFPPGQGQFVGVPIVPLSEENETAMEDEIFLSFLIKIGLAAPADEQVSLGTEVINFFMLNSAE